MPKRRYRSNNDIVQGLQIVSHMQGTLTRATHARLETYLELHPEHEPSRDTFCTIADSFVNQEGAQYFHQPISTLSLPEDKDNIKKLIVELLASQYSRMGESKEKRHKVRQHEVAELLTNLANFPVKTRSTSTKSPQSQDIYGDKTSCEKSQLPISSVYDVPDSPEIPPSTIHVRPLTTTSIDNSWSPSSEKTTYDDNAHIPAPSHLFGHLRGPNSTQPHQRSVTSLKYTSANRAPAANPELSSSSTDPLPPPPTISSIEHRETSISETTECRTEDVYKIDWGFADYDVNGQQCARVLRLTLALLDKLRTELNAATKQGRVMDCRAKFVEMYRDIEQELNM